MSAVGAESGLPAAERMRWLLQANLRDADSADVDMKRMREHSDADTSEVRATVWPQVNVSIESWVLSWACQLPASLHAVVQAQDVVGFWRQAVRSVPIRTEDFVAVRSAADAGWG